VLFGGLVMFAVLFAVTDGLAFEQQTVDPSPSYGVSSGDSISIVPMSVDPTLPEVVAAKVLPSIVNIDVYVKSSSGSSGGWGSDSSSDSGLEEYALGSGIVLSEDGYILTNYHVVEDGDEFMVRFDRDTQLRAVMVGSDPSSDLAVLKVDAKGLTPIDIGDSDKIAVGEWVMALGSPFGLEKTVSAGIVSALFRSTTMEGWQGTTIYSNMIQTDAAINPGNSGGALVNSRGELIGINTLIMSSVNSSAGVGFAIPSNYAMYIAEQILAGKPVEHAFLGVQMTTVDPSNAAALGTTAQAGAHVDAVIAGSPADQAGIRQGDVIVRIGEVPIGTGSEVILEVRGHKVGDRVSVTIIRDGTSQTMSITLGSDLNR
jgi:putative serine protease PepD